MPYLQQPDVGRQIPYRRSDHTISIPRPLHDARLGVENACQQCHRNQTPDRLQSQVTKWYGDLKPHPEPVTATLAAGSITEPRVAAGRILAARGTHPLAELVGLTDILKRYASPDAPEFDDETIEHLKRRAASIDPKIQATALATLHLARGADSEVRRFLSDQLRALGPREDGVRRRWAWILSVRGDSYLNAGEARSAITAYERANEITPDQSAILRQLGLASMMAGAFDQAIEHLRRSLERNPDQAQVIVELGVALMQKNDFDGATTVFRSAITVNPRDPLGYANLGVALLRQGDLRSSIEALAKAVSLDPSLADANFMLANAYAALGRRKEAVTALELSLEFAPRDAAARRMLDELRRDDLPSGRQ
jgi:tetratricopeptide (TPR) repeat protein